MPTLEMEIKAAVFSGSDNVIMMTALDWLRHTWPKFCKEIGKNESAEDLADRKAELDDLAQRFSSIAVA